ncbi:MAG: hypothetical protein QOD98_1771 [Nocardioidaceae bacterium]|nr:hypothetical protein [Nocardioidaceae bacterium]
MIVLVLVETVLIAVLTVLVAGLLRAHGTVLRRLHALDGGEGADAGFAMRAPAAPATQPGQDPDARDVTGETVDGELVTARVADVAHDTLLLFLSSGCESCGAFWGDLAGPVRLPVGTRLLVVVQDRDQESTSALARLIPAGVDVVLSSDAWRDYEVPGSPHAVFVDGPSGRVRGEGTGQSLRQVSDLLAQSTGDAGFVVTPSTGKPGRDTRQELEVDRALLAAGILPGDPRLYGEDS